MSDYGYFCIPRTLLNDSKWKSFNSKERHAYITFLSKMVFDETFQDDHGIEITVKPLQYLTTEREFAELCNENKPKDMKKFNDTYIHRFFLKMKKACFLEHEVKHTKTLLTCIRLDICEIEKKKNEARSEAKVKQERSKNEAQKNKDNKANKENKKKTNVFLSDSIEIGLANEFSSHLKSFLSNPKIPSNLQSWAKSFNSMLITDERKPDEIRAILSWLKTNAFWRKNILSPAKLQEKFDRLILERRDKNHETNIKRPEESEFHEPKFRANTITV